LCDRDNFPHIVLEHFPDSASEKIGHFHAGFKYVIIPLMLQIPKKLFELKYLLIAMAVLMLLSLSVHDLIPHDHPQEIFGTGIQAALHGNDKNGGFCFC